MMVRKEEGERKDEEEEKEGARGCEENIGGRGEGICMRNNRKVEQEVEERERRGVWEEKGCGGGERLRKKSG